METLAALGYGGGDDEDDEDGEDGEDGEDDEDGDMRAVWADRYFDYV
ncbi:hypothetical protein [Streptomyces sp. CS113]|nr:hypothetical protein [Streptomyces sp. CS113]